MLNKLQNMETKKSHHINGKKGPDLIDNNCEHEAQTMKNKNNGATNVKDQIVTADGRIFYPCQFCNKVFPIKKTRKIHIKNCSAKEYILSVDEAPQLEKEVNLPAEEKIIPKDKIQMKIDIQQNIVLSKQLDVDEILAKTRSPPIKLTIRRSNGSEVPDQFTVSNSLVLKEKNESNDEFVSIAKRLENNAVTIIPQTKKNAEKTEKSVEKTENTDTNCRECGKEFASPLELLRHSRNCHSYPKVLMALSEVKKFYTVKNRSECPICHKPLKTNFRSAFIKHLHTHTNEMKYSCHVCNKKFRRSDHMRAHEKRHVIKHKK